MYQTSIDVELEKHANSSSNLEDNLDTSWFSMLLSAINLWRFFCPQQLLQKDYDFTWILLCAFPSITGNFNLEIFLFVDSLREGFSYKDFAPPGLVCAIPLGFRFSAYAVISNSLLSNAWLFQSTLISTLIPCENFKIEIQLQWLILILLLINSEISYSQYFYGKYQNKFYCSLHN